MRKRVTLGDQIFDVLNTFIMILIGLLVLYPLYYVLLASFTDPNIVNSGQLLLYPKRLYLLGYQRILAFSPLWRGYANTVLYVVVGTIISLVTTVPCAYALSRKDLRWRRQLMLLFTFTMFFQGGLIPLFLVILNLHLYNTIWAMTLPTAVSVWNLIICRTFFESAIPDELLQASQIDGCTDFRFFFSIALPLSSTIIAVMTLFYSTGIWNSFFNPLMFLQDSEKMPLQVVLRNLVISNQATTMAVGSAQEMIDRKKTVDQLKYGIIVVSSLPLMMVYPFLQKYFAKGVMVGSIKG